MAAILPRPSERGNGNPAAATATGGAPTARTSTRQQPAQTGGARNGRNVSQILFASSGGSRGYVPIQPQFSYQNARSKGVGGVSGVPATNFEPGTGFVQGAFSQRGRNAPLPPDSQFLSITSGPNTFLSANQIRQRVQQQQRDPNTYNPSTMRMSSSQINHLGLTQVYPQARRYQQEVARARAGQPSEQAATPSTRGQPQGQPSQATAASSARGQTGTQRTSASMPPLEEVEDYNQLSFNELLDGPVAEFLETSQDPQLQALIPILYPSDDLPEAQRAALGEAVSNAFQNSEEVGREILIDLLDTGRVPPELQPLLTRFGAASARGTQGSVQRASRAYAPYGQSASVVRRQSGNYDNGSNSWNSGGGRRRQSAQYAAVGGGRRRQSQPGYGNQDNQYGQYGQYDQDTMTRRAAGGGRVRQSQPGYGDQNGPFAGEYDQDMITRRRQSSGSRRQNGAYGGNGARNYAAGGGVRTHTGQYDYDDDYAEPTPARRTRNYAAPSRRRQSDNGAQFNDYAGARRRQSGNTRNYAGTGRRRQSDGYGAQRTSRNQQAWSNGNAGY